MASITIVLIGGIHRDPAPTSIERQFYKKSEEAQIPFVYCQEDDCDNTLQRAIEGNNLFIKFAEKFLSNSHIKGILQRNAGLSRSFFLSSQGETIRRIVAMLNPSISRPALFEIGGAVQRYNHYKEAVRFKKLLLEKNIPFVPIDLKDTLKSVMQDDQQYYKMEAARIEKMSETILGTAVPKLGGRGIILVDTGMNHTERLAAQLSIKIKKLDQRIQLFSMIVFSGYSIDGYEDHSYTVRLSRNHDSQEVFTEYNKIQCHRVYCDEDLETQEFHSDLLSSLVSRIFSNQQMKKPSFFTEKELANLSSVSKRINSLVGIVGTVTY